MTLIRNQACTSPLKVQCASYKHIIWNFNKSGFQKATAACKTFHRYLFSLWAGFGVWVSPYGTAAYNIIRSCLWKMLSKPLHQVQNSHYCDNCNSLLLKYLNIPSDSALWMASKNSLMLLEFSSCNPRDDLKIR